MRHLAQPGAASMADHHFLEGLEQMHHAVLQAVVGTAAHKVKDAGSGWH